MKILSTSNKYLLYNELAHNITITLDIKDVLPEIFTGSGDYVFDIVDYLDKKIHDEN